MNKIIGPLKGKVVSVEDPNKLGKLLVVVPVVGSKEMWALPGVDLKNDWHLPSVNDVVWVYFQNGDINLPVWTWGWILGQDIDDETKLSYPNNSGAGDFKTIRWKNMKIVLKEDAIELKDQTERVFCRFCINDDVGIRIESDSDIFIKSDGKVLIENESFIVESGGNISLTTPNGLVINAGMNGEITITDQLIVKSGNKVNIHSSNEVKLEAGLTPADNKGISANATQTEINHPIQNIIKSIKNVLDGETNFIGSSSASEPLVLGIKLSSFLTSILQLIMTHTHPTPAGPSSPSVELTAGIPSKFSDIPNLLSKGNFTK